MEQEENHIIIINIVVKNSNIYFKIKQQHIEKVKKIKQIPQ